MVFFRSLLAAALVFGGPVPDLFAFSFGGIEVKSKFGERFKAEIELDADEGAGLQVNIGNEEDYKKLNLKRPVIVDELKIETPLETNESITIIRMTSKRPLFYPSFNLVLKATQGGGTLLENYLITVDFQRSLALNVKGAKKKKVKKPARQKKVDLLKGGQASPETPAAVPSPPVEAEEIPPVTAKAPAPPSETKESPPEAVAAPSPPAEAEEAPLVTAKAPAPMIGHPRHRRLLSGAVEVSPRAIPVLPSEPPEVSRVENAKKTKTLEVVLKSPEVETAPSPAPEVFKVSEGHTGPLQRGESLLSVAEKLKIPPGKKTRAVVALWLENQEKFIYGNMNGVRIGSDLSLVNLENRLAHLDLKTAKDLFKSQWEEWRVVQERFKSPETLENSGETEEEFLPSEQDSNLAQMFEVLGDWKASWEEGDFDRHQAHFFKGLGGKKSDSYLRLKSFKQRMFKLHKQVEIHTASPVLVRMMDHPTVTLEQSFSSQRMESLGRKDLRLTWEGLEWKIISEKFKVKNFREKRNPSPFADLKKTEPEFSLSEKLNSPLVIHASSHLDFPTATRVVNELRRKGLNAYSCPLYLSATRKIYRVYVGRIPDWELAQKLTVQIRKLSVGRFAVPMRIPYAIEAGSFRSEKEAKEKILSLRAQRISPFIFVTGGKDFKEPQFRVLIGAFAQPERAGRLLKEYREMGVSASLIEP
ncbi:MAG: SPOR domain-containing protein [Nitrospinaceae bacterium]